MIIFGKAILEKHQTPRYLWNRSRVWVNSLLRPNEPWMPRKAVLILEEIIRPTDKILEFGSGRSTLWFAERCQVLTSVEHNKDWYEQVKKTVKEPE